MSEASLADLQILKNAIAALVLPPGPLLVLALGGAWVARRRRGLGFALTAIACAALWATCCDRVAAWLEPALLHEPPALSAADIAGLAAAAARGEPAAIVVLGGGLTAPAPEYGLPTPESVALERLRYGVWLSRATGVPLAISGGTGWASPQSAADGRPAPREADVMGDIASREFGCPVRWRDSRSRDTHENALDTVALLAPQGVRTLVIVTHGWHMPRALREFRAAAVRSAAASGASAPARIRVVPAPMGMAGPELAPPLAWMPSGDGYLRVRRVLREALGLLLAP
jgi:uncharacterized SAM-binding protein YcdF (DUF218 family)